jgi:YHS domain-containing protein
MAKAKCKICGSDLDTNTAYKVTDKNGKNKYFCNQSEFETEEERKKKAQEDKDKVYRLVCDIMGEREIISTALFKEWQVWNKVANNEKIAKYLDENRDYLSSMIARLSSSEYARIRYLSAIIRDKIKAFVPKVEVVEKPRIVVDEQYETKYKAKTRVALLDIEEDCV